MRGVLSILLVAVLTAGSFCVGGRLSAAPPPGPIPQDLPELVRMAPLVVVGQVVEVRAGRVAGSDEGRLQFNDVHIGVTRAIKGDPSVTIVVEQVATAGRAVSSEAGPPYKVGERYVLFARSGEGHRYVVLPQGRYRLERGTVNPIGPGLVAERVKGLDEARFVREIEAVVQGKPRSSRALPGGYRSSDRATTRTPSIGEQSTRSTVPSDRAPAHSIVGAPA